MIPWAVFGMAGRIVSLPARMKDRVETPIGAECSDTASLRGS